MRGNRYGLMMDVDVDGPVYGLTTSMKQEKVRDRARDYLKIILIIEN